MNIKNTFLKKYLKNTILKIIHSKWKKLKNERQIFKSYIIIILHIIIIR